MGRRISWITVAVTLVAQPMLASLVVLPNQYQSLEGSNSKDQLVDIGEIGFRFDDPVLVREFDSGLIRRLQFDVTKAAKTPVDLISTVADNIGPDDRMVFDGSIDWLSASQGTSSFFDLTFSLQSQFQYDLMGGHDSPSPDVVTEGFQQPEWTASAVPEPGRLLVSAGGLIAIAFWSVRRWRSWYSRRWRPTFEQVRSRVFQD